VKSRAVRRIRPADKTPPGRLGRWTVELRDKTRLTGMPLSKSLRVRTDYGTMVVPLARIQEATFAADRKAVRVHCRGSDRIVGTVGSQTAISIATDKGKVDVPAEKIAAAGRAFLRLDLGRGATMRLVLIPAGKFLMGSAKSEPGHKDNEGPQREVTISKPFYMGVCEVTQWQWRAVMGTSPWGNSASAKSGDNFAASYISWKKATKFCKALSKTTGRKVALPTEAQWEYACRAGSKMAFCFGDDASKLDDYAWYDDNADAKGEKYAHAVCQKRPNAFGLYDMHGNVYEWCRDWYDGKFYAKAENVDPENTGKTKARVLRGGSWWTLNEHSRSANRSGGSVDERYDNNGFRVVVADDGMD